MMRADITVNLSIREVEALVNSLANELQSRKALISLSEIGSPERKEREQDYVEVFLPMVHKVLTVAENQFLK